MELDLRSDDTGKFDTPLLIRQSYPEFFTFDYDLHPMANGSTPAVLTLSSYRPTSLAFSVERVQDIGGTLVIGMGLKPTVEDAKKEEIGSTATYTYNKVKVGVYTIIYPS